MNPCRCGKCTLCFLYEHNLKVRVGFGGDKNVKPLPGRPTDYVPRPYPEGFYGRGVVVVAGGSYNPSAYVTIRMLRRSGCDLPVELWFLGGRGELPIAVPENDVTWIDIDSHKARAERRVVNGFEAKLFAVMNSRFEEVLFLDADNYPCLNPAPLFDHPDYKRLGAIYWPDLPHTNAWTKWGVWGVEPWGPACGLETGQYLVNKKVGWEPLHLAEWYDDHSDYFYKGDYGDKGPHRVAWAGLKREYVMFSTTAVWKTCAFLQPGPDGKTPMFVHRCRSKLSVDGRFRTTGQSGVNMRAGLPGEDAAFGFLREVAGGLDVSKSSVSFGCCGGR